MEKKIYQKPKMKTIELKVKQQLLVDSLDAGVATIGSGYKASWGSN